MDHVTYILFTTGIRMDEYHQCIGSLLCGYAQDRVPLVADAWTRHHNATPATMTTDKMTFLSPELVTGTMTIVYFVENRTTVVTCVVMECLSGASGATEMDISRIFVMITVEKMAKEAI